jgi:hypothetical protein
VVGANDQLRTRLSTTRKGDQFADVYYNKMKGFEDEMTSTGKPLEDEDFISYVPAGLDHDYNSFCGERDMENRDLAWLSILLVLGC